MVNETDQRGRGGMYKSPVQDDQRLNWWGFPGSPWAMVHMGCNLLAMHRDTLTREHRAVSTVNCYLSALSHAFFIAVREWGWLDDSRMRNVTKLREPRGRVRYLSDEERHQLLEACQTSPGTLPVHHRGPGALYGR